MKFIVVILGAFAKFRKRLLRSFALSACPSVRSYVRMEQLGSHWTDFNDIWYLRIFWKSSEKIQVRLTL